MSRTRGLLTPVLVTSIGVVTGITIFNPSFKEVKEQREHDQNVEFQEQHPPSPSPEEQIRKTEETVANAGGATTIPKDTERWAMVQSGQFSKPADTFRWSDVPLDRYSNSEDSS